MGLTVLEPLIYANYFLEGSLVCLLLGSVFINHVPRQPLRSSHKKEGHENSSLSGIFRQDQQDLQDFLEGSLVCVLVGSVFINHVPRQPLRSSHKKEGHESSSLSGIFRQDQHDLQDFIGFACGLDLQARGLLLRSSSYGGTSRGSWVAIDA